MVFIACFVEHTMTSYISTSGEGLAKHSVSEWQSQLARLS